MKFKTFRFENTLIRAGMDSYMEVALATYNLHPLLGFKNEGEVADAALRPCAAPFAYERDGELGAFIARWIPPAEVYQMAVQRWTDKERIRRFRAFINHEVFAWRDSCRSASEDEKLAEPDEVCSVIRANEELREDIRFLRAKLKVAQGMAESLNGKLGDVYASADDLARR